MSRLSPHVRPSRYDLHVHVDPRREEFSGQVAIELHVARRTQRLELNAVDLAIGDVRLEGPLGSKQGPIGVEALELDAKAETAAILAERALAPGDYVLHLSWTGPIRPDLRGLYAARSGRRRYAVTQLEATDARRFFPSFDQPDMKARFALRVTTPKANQVIANGAQRSGSVKGGLRTVRFEETPPISTYLVALVVGPLASSPVRRSGKTPIRVWCVPGKEQLTGFALDVAAAVLPRLERYFGIPYPYGKLDMIAVPDFEFGAMENVGAVIYRETLLLSDPKTITRGEMKRVAEVICHELAHMWYGNLVTMAWWDDLWLNEAFATWMAFKIVDQWKPEWEMWLAFEQIRGGAYSLDSLVNTHAIYTPVEHPDEATENFDRITYEKGASVVRMVERWLGEAAFRKGVRAYVRAHREGNARAADLWNALAEASGQSVAPTVRAWIEQPGFPLVTVERTDANGRAALSFRQERFFASPKVKAAERRVTWPIPAVVRVRREEARRKDEQLRTLVKQRTGRLALGTASDVRWAYANAEESGFYHPLHDARTLAAIAAELPRLEPAERMGLVGHQWAGLRADRAPLTDFLDLVAALGDEAEPEVLGAAAGPLSWLDDQVVPNLRPADRAAWRGFLVETFEPAFDALGWKVGKGEPESAGMRRAVLAGIAGRLGRSERIAEQVEERIDRYLRSRSVIAPDLAGPLVSIAASAGDAKRYDAYLATMRKARTPQERSRFEMGLADFERKALVRRTCELLLSDDVPTQDVVPVIVRLLGNPEARDAAWAFVRKSWKKLSPRISTGLASRLVAALPALQTREARREVQAFFRAHPLPSAARTLKQALERFDLDAELRRRAKPQLAAWLAKRGQPA